MGSTIFREETPAPGEALIADLALKNCEVPGEFHEMKIPSAAKSADGLAKGKQLFEVECAMCHGQGGRGDADLGNSCILLRPISHRAGRKARPQRASYSGMVAHGINLSGMPAWGTKYGGGNTDDEIWSMIAYIRTLHQ